VTYKEREPTHGTNPYCSATPVTDGQRVIVSHGSAGMYCYDMDGKELWNYELGDQFHIWGNASSPILYKDLCVIWAGPGERQFLLAVNKKTGKKVWQHNESGGSYGKDGPKDWVGSWSTPVVIDVAGRKELILTVPHKVKGFNPDTGKELWRCDGLGPLVYTSPVVSKDGIVLAMSGFHNAALAVKAGGNGDVTKTHRLWHKKPPNPQRIGSAVIVGDHAYIISTPGIPQCFELKTGKEVWKAGRLGAECWGSMVLIGDKLYVANGEGNCYVLAASPKFKVLAVNPLGSRELVRASIAVADGELYIRSYQHLWCIAKKE
jgi:outer membrane protein assembly factor BamB